jgi:CubicO group peptidase (beta-lactamase class C family)
MEGKQKLMEVLNKGLRDGVFPGAVTLVAQRGKIDFFEHVGYRSLVPGPAPMKRDTIFDLASLTKIFATVPAVMKLVDERRIALDDPLSKLIPSANLGDKSDVTPRLLLTHSAGLIDWRPFFEKLRDHPLRDRKRLLREWIIEEPFAYERGKGSLYSDLGFMLLEWVIEEKTGKALPGFVQEKFYGPLGLKRTMFRGTSEQGNSPQPPFIKGGI